MPTRSAAPARSAAPSRSGAPSRSAAPTRYDIIVTTTIQAAHDAATAGQRIYVPAGTYRETLTITKALDITFETGAIIDGRSAGGSYDRTQWVVVAADDVILRNPQCQYSGVSAGGSTSGSFRIASGSLRTHVYGGSLFGARGWSANLGYGSDTVVDGLVIDGGYLGMAFSGGSNNAYRNMEVKNCNAPQVYGAWMGTIVDPPGASGVWTTYPEDAGLVYRNPEFEAGGAKGLSFDNTIFEFCWFHDNWGPQIWTDHVSGDETLDITVRYCRIEDGYMSAIFHEISNGLVAHDNFMRGNNWSAFTDFSRPASTIKIASGLRATIRNNVIVVRNSRSGILFYNSWRADGPVSATHEDHFSYDNDMISEGTSSSNDAHYMLDHASEGASDANGTGTLFWQTAWSSGNRYWYPSAEGSVRWRYRTQAEGGFTGSLLSSAVGNATALPLNNEIGPYSLSPGDGGSGAAGLPGAGVNSTYLTTQQKTDILAGDPGIAGGLVVAGAGPQ